MNAQLFEESRMSELDRATKDYEDAKGNYQRMVRQAISEKDPKKRDEYVKAIEAENIRLSRVVQGLVAAWSEGDLKYSDLAQNKVSDFEKELEDFRHDIEELRAGNDQLAQLKTLFNTLTNENASERKTFYGYIVAILVLLIIVFVFFVYSYASSVVSSVTETVSNVVSPPSTDYV